MPDEFWSSVVQNIAMGKYPRCVYFSNSTLFSTDPKHPASYTIPSSSTPREVSQELYTFLSTQTPLSSLDDTNKKKELLQKKRKLLVSSSEKWSMIKKKNVKELIIINYVLREKKERSLSWDQTKQLLQCIRLGFIYHLQSSKDVEYMNGEIQSIKGIEWNEETLQFENKKLQVVKKSDKLESSSSSSLVHLDDDEKPVDSSSHCVFLSSYWERYISFRVRFMK